MSYDYHVVKLARQIAYLRELPETMVSLGSWSDVRQQISDIIPGINWDDGGGSLHTEVGWIEFRIGKDRPLDHGFTIRTSHRSDHQWEESLMRDLCRALDWSIIDRQSPFGGEHPSEAYTMLDARGVRQVPGYPEGSSGVE